MEDLKICASCGRRIEYRKKWAHDWPSVKFCSDECKRNKNNFEYRSQILALLSLRQAGQTICPSEVLKMEEKSNKVLMEHVRRSARLLAHAGLIEITQKGQRVNPDDFKGPIRLRLKKKSTSVSK
jgi:hypothetical protein